MIILGKKRVELLFFVICLELTHFYKCNCGKEYILSGSFSNHKKTCKFFVNKQEKSDNTELLLEKLEEQNKKIEQLEQTIIDNPTNQYITNNDNSTTNNKFNLNIFLICKFMYR